MANTGIYPVRWDDFFKEYPWHASSIINFARRHTISPIIKLDDIPQSVLYAFDAALSFSEIKEHRLLSYFYCITYTSTDKSNEPAFDLTEELYNAIHRHQIDKVKKVLNSDSFIDNIQSLLKLSEHTDITRRSLSTFSDFKASFDDKNRDTDLVKEYKNHLDKVWDKINNHLSNDVMFSSIDDLKKCIHDIIEENIKNSKDPEKYKGWYNNYFDDDFYCYCKSVFFVGKWLKDYMDYAVYDINAKFSTIVEDLTGGTKEENYREALVIISSAEVKELVQSSLDNCEVLEHNVRRATEEEICSENTKTATYLNTLLSKLKRKKNLILQGAPGVGKTYTARKIMEHFKREGETHHVRFVTFHQTYDYEDFIEGIHVETKDGKISYKRQSGVFKKICDDARMNPNEDFLIVIDEINRGNISKIFGELISLIEEDKRDDGKNRLEVNLPSGEPSFTVPGNVYILGTMNTTDRSVGRIDYALRRRFAFETVLASKDKIKGKNGQDLFDKVKDYIDQFKDDEVRNVEDIMIGHSYFNVDEDDKKLLYSKWKDEIQPLLEEYMNDGLIRYHKALQWYNELEDAPENEKKKTEYEIASALKEQIDNTEPKESKSTES